MLVYVSASIVLYKSDIQVRRTIADFLNTTLHVKLYLVDNSPTNQLFYDLSDLIADTRVEYIFNNKNLGFGSAHNIAIRQIIHSSKYHLVLNPDVYFKQGVIEELSTYLVTNQDVGLVIPKVFYADGRLQHVCKLLPTPFDLIVRRFLPKFLFRKRMQKFELRHIRYDREFEAPYIHGCFMFLRTEALKKIGLFDERFFMYPEDIDLTRRMHKEFRTMFYPHVSIIHEHNKGSYKSTKLLWVHIVNMIKYFNKWGWVFDKERRIVNTSILSEFE